MKYEMKWELDSIYEGGSQSSALKQDLANTEQYIAELNHLLKQDEAIEVTTVVKLSGLVQLILLHVRQMDSFVSCLMAQDMFDKQAVVLLDKIKQLHASFTAALTLFDNRLRSIDDETWNKYMSQAELKEIAFNLSERRELAKRQMAPELEALAADLAIDGYHAWGDFYNTIVSRTNFKVDEHTYLSAGQMANRLSEGDRTIRAEAFKEWEKVWGEQADLCADTLNHLAGFRLKWYSNRKWSSALEEPLQMNRMSEATLAAMWQAVEKGKQLLEPYFKRKAELLGLEKLDWHDVEAPLAESSTTMSFDKAAEFIIEQFRDFSPDMADFAQHAFEKQWIEAEDRAGKRPGGFCTSLPKSGETRIFMTYSGSASNVSTLAHELGHAYHQHVMNDMSALTQEYAMNVAETASTFAELIVSDKALKAASTVEEKLALVDDKIQRAIAFYMNIHARFIFESQFYKEREQGLVSAERLNELMEGAQKQAFNGLLGIYHPHFWVSKLHFYLTDVPFYNFPYTFGYLFSAAIYHRALQQGTGFAHAYDELLRDTGRLTVEELAQKHLGADVTLAEFWEEGALLVEEDVALFLQLTAN